MVGEKNLRHEAVRALCARMRRERSILQLDIGDVIAGT